MTKFIYFMMTKFSVKNQLVIFFWKKFLVDYAPPVLTYAFGGGLCGSGVVGAGGALIGEGDGAFFVGGFESDGEAPEEM